MDGAVYFGTASHCDHGAYVGYVGRRCHDRAATRSCGASESGAATNEAGIWQSGGGLMSDGPGRIFLATGNGISPPPGPGSSRRARSPSRWSGSASNGDGTLTAHGLLQPGQQRQARPGRRRPRLRRRRSRCPTTSGRRRTRICSSSPARTAWSGCSTATTSAAMRRARTARSRRRLDCTGKRRVGAGGRVRRPARAGRKHYVYLLPSTAPLQALPGRAERERRADDEHVARQFGVVRLQLRLADRDLRRQIRRRRARLGRARIADRDGSGAMLQAFPAVPPTTGPWHPMWQAPLGTAAKFIQPATDGGRVFVATRDGRVLAFGRPTTAAVTRAADRLRDAAGRRHRARRRSPSPRTAPCGSPRSLRPGRSPPARPPRPLPATLDDGETLTVPVTFAPTAPGSTSGVLHVTASGDPLLVQPERHRHPGRARRVTGRARLRRHERRAGQPARRHDPEHRDDAGHDPGRRCAASAPFTIDGLPGEGVVIQPQESVSGNILFQPNAAQTYDDELEITANTGSVTVAARGPGLRRLPEDHPGPRGTRLRQRGTGRDPLARLRREEHRHRDDGDHEGHAAVAAVLGRGADRRGAGGRAR